MIIWCYKGALRESECTNIKSTQIRVNIDPENHITCMIQHNPTSSQKEGKPSGIRTKNKKDRKIFLPEDKDNLWKCPWTIFSYYLKATNNRTLQSDPPEFVFYNLTTQKQLSKTHVNHALQRLLKRVNMTHIDEYKTRIPRLQEHNKKISPSHSSKNTGDGAATQSYDTLNTPTQNAC